MTTVRRITVPAYYLGRTAALCLAALAPRSTTCKPPSPSAPAQTGAQSGDRPAHHGSFGRKFKISMIPNEPWFPSTETRPVCLDRPGYR
jgi:hypothetical protein